MLNRTRIFWLILPLLLFHALAFQGYRDLREPDEGRYTNVALQMIRMNDWLVPHRHPEQEHWTKPPLVYWAIAASVSAIGHSRFATRLPGALGYLFAIVAVYFAGRVLMPERAWLPPLIYATLFGPFLASNIVTTDSLLTVWELGAVAFFVYARWGPRASRRGPALVGMWALFGLAFLTKGPPGMLPLLAILTFNALVPPAESLSKRYWAAGILAWAVLGLSWFAVLAVQRPDLIRLWLVGETLDRFTGNHQNAQIFGAFTVYLPVLLVGTLPWTWNAWRAVSGRTRALVGVPLRQMETRQSQDLFLLLWLGIPLAVFVLTPARLPLYVLPLFAPLALLAARGMNRPAKLLEPRSAAMLAIWAVGLLSTRVWLEYVPWKDDVPRIAEAIETAAAGRPIGEVVTVGPRSLQGLHFYLGTDVEPLHIQEVAHEWGEPVTGRVWVVHPRAVDAFLETVPSGRRVRERGRAEGFVIFLETPGSGLDPPIDDPGASSR